MLLRESAMITEERPVSEVADIARYAWKCPGHGRSMQSVAPSQIHVEAIRRIWGGTAAATHCAAIRRDGSVAARAANASG